MNKFNEESCLPYHSGLKLTSKNYDWDPWSEYDRPWEVCKKARKYILRFYYKHKGEPYKNLANILNQHVKEKFGDYYARELREMIFLNRDDGTNGWSLRYDWFILDENNCITPNGYPRTYEHKPFYISIDGENYEVTAHRKSSYYKRMRAETNQAKKVERRNRKKQLNEYWKNYIIDDGYVSKRERALNLQKIIKHGFDPDTSFRKW